MIVDNNRYSLPKRVKLEAINDKTIGIVKLIKSRIIQKDIKRIIEISEKIKEVDRDKNITLICTENICSKSKLLLKENGISISFRNL